MFFFLFFSTGLLLLEMIKVLMCVGGGEEGIVHLNTDQRDGFEPPTPWRSALEGGGREGGEWGSTPIVSYAFL